MDTDSAKKSETPTIMTAMQDLSPMLCGIPELPADPEAASAWIKESIKIVHTISEQLPEQAIPQLGRILYQFGKYYKMNPPKDEELIVVGEAQRALVAIPGHAEYYADRVNSAWNRLEEVRQKDPNGDGVALHDLVSEQGYDFLILAMAPSPETVKVLGEFLSDNRGAYLPEKNQHPKTESGEHANSLEASLALSRLPLVDRPITIPWRRITSSKIESVTHTWELWYAQVKAGNRTFRFEGDDKEYSLKGPVTVSASAGDRSSSTIASSTPRPTDVVKPEASIWPMALCIVVVLLLSGGWLLILQKNRGISPK